MFNFKTVFTSIAILIISLSFCFISACTTTRTESSPPQYVNSSFITLQVKERLFKELKMNSAHISVTTYRDTVTLSGYVYNHKQEEQAIDVARGVNGVKYVVDNLKVKSD
ncbi:MAG TPA: BON domain-containing protein [Gammaproteobacteria bacterium]|nr:BON domain-containing protein [Gammaproteobacteria bacterium]